MSRPPSLLIIDDDMDNRVIASEALTDAGWRVDLANDGDAAVRRAFEHRYALILIGLRVPALDGLVLARTVRSSKGASAAAPILAFCAASQYGTSAAFRNSGMDGHVAKPFTPETLCAAVERWRPVQKTAPIAALVATFGAIQIAALLDGFRDQLEAQLRVDDDERHTETHRLAGIAGILGFPEVSRLWLAVSEGDDTVYAEARIAARKALAEIHANPIITDASQAQDTGR